MIKLTNRLLDKMDLKAEMRWKKVSFLFFLTRRRCFISIDSEHCIAMKILSRRNERQAWIVYNLFDGKVFVFVELNRLIANLFRIRINFNLILKWQIKKH